MGATIIKDREWVETITFSHDFEIREDPSAGFSFPVDEDTKKEVFSSEAAQKNYEYCLSQPDKIRDLGIVRHVSSYRTDPIARCECGKEIELFNEYLGACECPHCGRWHNLFGQTLQPPKYWDM